MSQESSRDGDVSAPLSPLHAGGCHCGAVRFEARADLSNVLTCNCSICSAKGLLLAFTPADAFTLLQGQDRLNEYRFNKHVIGHMFCTACGVEPFAQGLAPDGTAMVALNVRCIDGIDPATLTLTPYDGRAA